jgi:hypothetical protein
MPLYTDRWATLPWDRAFPHCAFAFEIPQATLGHHWQDSTHCRQRRHGLQHSWLRLEASGFSWHGTKKPVNIDQA